MYDGGSGPQVGILQDDAVINLALLASAQKRNSFPASILVLIEGGPHALDDVRSVLKAGRDGAEVGDWIHPLDEMKILPPLDPPRGDVVAIGRNY